MIMRTAAAALACLAATSAALAQREPPPRPPEKFSPRPVQPAPSPGASALNEGFVYSPWTKFCGKDSNPETKEICLTVKEARRPSGQFVAGAALIEQAGVEKKLRVTLPSNVDRAHGARISIDDDPARSGNDLKCIQNGCMADFSIDQEFIARLKTGRFLHMEGMIAGAAARYRFPLDDFAGANAGRPTDPKAFEEQQKRRWEERSRDPAARPQ